MVAPMGLIKKSPTSILIIPFVINMFIKMKIFWHDDFFLCMDHSYINSHEFIDWAPLKHIHDF